LGEQGAEETVWTSGKEVKGEWRNLHNEELQNMSSSPNIIRAIKLNRIR
jgi:hypothetical protein